MYGNQFLLFKTAMSLKLILLQRATVIQRHLNTCWKYTAKVYQNKKMRSDINEYLNAFSVNLSFSQIPTSNSSDQFPVFCSRYHGHLQDQLVYTFYFWSLLYYVGRNFNF